MKKIIETLSSGLGIGYLPYAPGTFATLITALTYWFLLSKNQFLNIIVTSFVLIISVPISSKAEDYFGNKDDKRIIIDEIVGFLICMLFIPRSVILLISAFIIFRILDIYKPLYIKKSQKLPKGWGIVFDDIIAGFYTNIILQVLIYFKVL